METYTPPRNPVSRSPQSLGVWIKHWATRSLRRVTKGLAVLLLHSSAAGPRVCLPSLALKPNCGPVGVTRVASETSNANYSPAARLPDCHPVVRHWHTAISAWTSNGQFLRKERFGHKILPALSTTRKTKYGHYLPTQESKNIQTFDLQDRKIMAFVLTSLSVKLRVTTIQFVIMWSEHCI